jgi:lysophospholipase L1-like esterase
MTPLASFEADLAILMPRLAATGAQIFLANLPQPSLLPLTRDKRALMIERAVEEAKQGGGDEAAAAALAAQQADAAIGEVDAIAVAFNERLEQAAAEHANVHIVDLATAVADVAVTGIEAGGQTLTSQKLGGLLSFDGVHFTDSGYALVANVFIETINETLGTSVQAIDLAPVVAQDAGSPAAIAAAGLDVSRCDR